MVAARAARAARAASRWSLLVNASVVVARAARAASRWSLLVNASVVAARAAGAGGVFHYLVSASRHGFTQRECVRVCSATRSPAARAGRRRCSRENMLRAASLRRLREAGAARLAGRFLARGVCPPRGGRCASGHTAVTRHRHAFVLK